MEDLYYVLEENEFKKKFLKIRCTPVEDSIIDITGEERRVKRMDVKREWTSDPSEGTGMDLVNAEAEMKMHNSILRLRGIKFGTHFSIISVSEYRGAKASKKFGF